MAQLESLERLGVSTRGEGSNSLGKLRGTTTAGSGRRGGSGSAGRGRGSRRARLGESRHGERKGRERDGEELHFAGKVKVKKVRKDCGDYPSLRERCLYVSHKAYYRLLGRQAMRGRSASIRKD